MGNQTATYGHVTLDVASADVALAADLENDRQSIRLTHYSEPTMVYLDGTADELAQFVHDLASVVRDLLIRELAATA